ncbi:MAG: polymer-forming cytoskeletal protein [Thermoanaerobaculia bacterium]|nr:polymer-forming cytoskeletal protein [Thermoanaerobaculia bacterium]
MIPMPALGLALALAAAPAPGPDAPALVLERGAVARHQMVAVGRDVLVEGEALAGVTALDGTARISGSVAGDVTVLGGDAVLDPTAVVRGHVQVLGGRLRAAPGARIDGRTVAYPTFSRAWLTLLEGPSLGLPAGSPVVVGAKLGLVAAWLALTVGLFAAGGRALGEASREVRDEPWLCFATGLVAVLALFLTGMMLSALLPAPFALPLLVLVVLAALAAKLWGTVAVFHAAGRALVGRRRRAPLLHEACVGLAVLGAVKFVPWLGVAVWSAITFVGVGAALRTQLDRARLTHAAADQLA